jgi:hypothetical protein
MSDANGIIFYKGHLIADNAGPGSADVEFGELQDCSFEGRDTTTEAYGPDSIHELASDLVSREVTLRASYLRVKAQGVALLTGGTVSYAGNKTTIAVGKTSLPTTFKAILSSPSDGSGIQIVLYKVQPTNFSIPMAMKEYTKPNFECKVMVDDNDKVYDIILPGYQSVN